MATPKPAVITVIRKSLGMDGMVMIHDDELARVTGKPVKSVRTTLSRLIRNHELECLMEADRGCPPLYRLPRRQEGD